MSRPFLRAAAAASFLLLAGCRQELHHGLSEGDAQEMQALLARHGLDARSESEGGREKRYRLTIERDGLPNAVRLLREHHLPRALPPGLGEVFGGGSMVATPAEERARLVRGLSGEVARLLLSVEGVLDAKVVVIPAQTAALRPGTQEPARASVLLQADVARVESLEARRPALVALVAGAVPGLEPAQVALLIDGQAVVQPPTEVVVKERGAVLALGLLSLAILGAMGALLSRLLARERQLQARIAELEAAAQAPEEKDGEAPTKSAPTKSAAPKAPTAGVAPRKAA